MSRDGAARFIHFYLFIIPFVLFLFNTDLLCQKHAIHTNFSFIECFVYSLLHVFTVYLDESSPDSSLRRSCSLSDLSMQMPVVSKRKVEQGKRSALACMRNGALLFNFHSKYIQFMDFWRWFLTKFQTVSGKKSQIVTRNQSRYAKNNSMMTRSRSSGVLNQSDSETESTDKKMSRLMRPTISSHNKINKTLQSRKKQSYSTSK